ncbi:MAG: protein kinase domain-containing protein [Actinoallomurus sp.]
MLERELGRGGMATVYAAHDVRHDRPVALKVLHPELAASLGPERFEREIHFAAQLQHPHILPVHDSGEAAGRLYYVMPYVEGESLRQRLARDGELPVADAVRLLEEIVEALAYAHAHGVVHRDIKPDNIMLSGRHALIADLGVAKAVSAAGRGDEALTATGIALGTPRYMAPEQVAADPHVDHRADIYAVGVMAYEMLSGTPPFAGASAQAVFAAQVTQQPAPLETLRPGISPLLSQTIVKCLAPRPADRWQSAAELLAQLERLRDSGEVTPPGREATPRPRRALAWGVAAVIAAAAAIAALTIARRPAPELHFGARSPLTVDPGLEIDPAVSPDGQFVAYAAGPLTESRIYVRQTDGGRPIAIAPDLAGAQRLPYWSPDGKRILFRSARGIEIVPALGGAPKVIVPHAVGEVLLPGPWSPDGRQIAFERSDSLCVMPADGGAPALLARGGDMHSFAWSPDGRWIAAVRGNRQSVDPDIRWFYGNLGQSAVWLVPARPNGGPPVRVTDDSSFHATPLWLPDGRGLLFLSNADGGLDVYRLALERSGAAKGRPERMTTGLNAHAISIDGAGHRLAYEVFDERSNVWSLPVPARPPVGLAEAAQVTSGNQVVETLDGSHDGRWLAFDSDRSGTSQIYRVPVAGGEPEQLTTGSSDLFWPRWSPDGRELTYHGFVGGRRRLFLMAADGGTPVELPTGEGDERCAEWKRDGRGVYYLHDYDAPDAEVRFLPRDASGRWGAPVTVMRIDALPTVESPDGRRVAFTTNRGLMMTTARGDSARVLLPVSYRARDLRPTYLSWPADSRTFYYLALDSLDRASIWGIDPSTADRKLLVSFDDPGREWHRYGFAAFGGRFYFTLGDRESDLWMTSVGAGPGAR